MGLLDNLTDMVEEVMQDKASPVDNSIMEDPVAQKTSWGPAKSGGTNVGTNVLRETSPDRMEFKARISAMIFPGLFMGVGIFIIVATIQQGIQKSETLSLVVGPIIGLIFFLAGFFIMRSWMTPRVFDKGRRLYWKGRRAPDSGTHQEIKNKRTFCQLKEIYAIQLISERCHSSSSSSSRRRTYYSYELNLVLNDGNRINVVDHGNRKLIRSDAAKLAEFLGVPLWDRT